MQVIYRKDMEKHCVRTLNWRAAIWHHCTRSARRKPILIAPSPPFGCPVTFPVVIGHLFPFCNPPLRYGVLIATPEERIRFFGFNRGSKEILYLLFRACTQNRLVLIHREFVIIIGFFFKKKEPPRPCQFVHHDYNVCEVVALGEGYMEWKIY